MVAGRSPHVSPFVLVEDHVADRDIGGHGLEVVHHFVALVLAGVEKIYLAGLVEVKLV